MLIAGAITPGLPGKGHDLEAAYHLDPLLIPRPARFAFGNSTLSFRVGSGFVLPGDTVEVQVAAGGVPGRYTLGAEDGLVERLGPRTWRWIAPETPGLVRLVAADSVGIDSMRIHAFVMVPYASLRGGVLNGYRIGSYPGVREIGGVRYERPLGFIEVTEDNRFTELSPHFQLGQFECSQSTSYPKYVVLTERLVAKLEAIVEGLRQAGHPVQTLGIMSAYRTPWYNASLGNVKYSRHQYGDAVDFFVDASPMDGRMDDLNGDGKVNADDARMLQCIIEGLAVDAREDIQPGGLGTYRTSQSHGPFVHTDARGYRTRWGATTSCEHRN